MRLSNRIYRSCTDLILLREGIIITDLKAKVRVDGRSVVEN